MKHTKTNLLILAGLLALTTATGLYAAEGGHKGHGPTVAVGKTPPASGTLSRLPKMPESGAAREAGYDGRYAMEPTTALDDTATRCAKASRGLIMVDNATWAQCGGKPEGWSKGPGKAKPMDHSGMGH